MKRQNKQIKVEGAAEEAVSPGHLLNRSMPESLEAEAAVLGSIIIDPQCAGQVIGLINADRFYRFEHQLIFDALLALYEKNTESDIVLLRDELKKRKQLEEIGGVEYLKKLAESVPSSANVLYYANIVKDKALLRELIQASTEVINDAYSEEGEPSEKLDAAEQKIFSVTQKKITGSAVSVHDLMLDVMHSIEGRSGSHVTGLDTGFRELNELTCGLQKGEMIIIAGRPSMGKTSFALNVAEHIGADMEQPVAIFSLEMSKQQLAERMLCGRAMVDSQAARKGMLNEQQWKDIVDACGNLTNKPIFIDDSPGLTPLEIRAKSRRLKSQHKIQCVFIDYLQLMSAGHKIESRQQEISTISRYLKDMAREMDIPVVVLSQLNRAPEGREDHRPRMSDLRESGSIEQDADVVILLHREDYYHRGEQDYSGTNEAEIIVAKQRNGPTDTIKLVFNEKFTRFADPSPFYVQEPD